MTLLMKGAASVDTGEVRGRDRTKPLLSVIVLSTGTLEDLQRAMSLLLPAVRSPHVQVVVGREETVSNALQALIGGGHVTFVRAPRGGGRAALVDAAMPAVRGDLVAIREDVAVFDAEWLTPYRVALGLADVVADRPPARPLAFDDALLSPASRGEKRVALSGASGPPTGAPAAFQPDVSGLRA